MMLHQSGIIEGVQPKFETEDIKVPLELGLLIRGIICAFGRPGLNLVEVALPEQILSVITGHHELEILEETGEYK